MKIKRAKATGSLLLLAVGLLSIPAFAQRDPSGEWAPRFHEDQPERIPGPEIGDYLGIPINASGAVARATAGTHLFLSCLRTSAARIRPTMPGAGRPICASGRISTPRAGDHRLSHPYLLAGAGANHLDGRPRRIRPDYAAHTWQGFSTGKWEGDMLTVTTDAPERGLDPAQRRSAQREGHHDRAHHPAWQLLDRGGDHQRSGVSDRAVYSYHRFRDRRRPADCAVPL